MKSFDIEFYKTLLSGFLVNDVINLDILDFDNLQRLSFHLKLMNKFCGVSLELKHKHLGFANSIREEIGDSDERYRKFKKYEKILMETFANMDFQGDLKLTFNEDLLTLETDLGILNQIYIIEVRLNDNKQFAEHYKVVNDIDLTCYSCEKVRQILREMYKDRKNRHELSFELEDVREKYNEFSQLEMNLLQTYFMVSKQDYVISSVDYVSNTIRFKQKEAKGKYSIINVNNEIPLTLTLIGCSWVELRLPSDEVRTCKLKKQQYEFLMLLAEMFSQNRNCYISYSFVIGRLLPDIPDEKKSEFLYLIYKHSKALRYQLRQGLCLHDSNEKTGQLFFSFVESKFYLAPNVTLEISEKLQFIQ